MSPLLCALVVAAWPAEVPLPPGTALNADTLSEVSFAELQVKEGAKPVRVRGHRWRAWAESQTHGAALWEVWKPLLVAKGWKPTSDEDGHSLKRLDGKTEWRLLVSTPDYDAPAMTVAKVGGAPVKLELAPPRANAPPVKDTDDFPFAPVFTGQALTGTGRSETAFLVMAKEPRFIADAQLVKSYRAPPGLSRLEAVLASADALARAGWDVVVTNEADGYVQAHYARNGRDLWLHVSHREDGTEQALTYGVVDVGEEDYGQALDAACRLTLRGVTFDFDKATLRPESDAVLARVAAALSARPALKLEVAGHTDAQGADAYNQKLSDARAAAVVAWLTAHGVSPGRLTARGYGESHPVADNGTDEGRARNRRVELVCAR